MGGGGERENVAYTQKEKLHCLICITAIEIQIIIEPWFFSGVWEFYDNSRHACTANMRKNNFKGQELCFSDYNYQNYNYISCLEISFIFLHTLFQHLSWWFLYMHTHIWSKEDGNPTPKKSHNMRVFSVDQLLSTLKMTWNSHILICHAFYVRHLGKTNKICYTANISTEIP